MADCMKNTANTNECKLLREDYQECLHHTKEVAYLFSFEQRDALGRACSFGVCFCRKWQYFSVTLA